MLVLVCIDHRQTVLAGLIRTASKKDVTPEVEESLFADLRLPWGGALEMNGRSVILQAGRKLPAGIGEVLGRAGIAAADVEVFLVHQANKNLIDRVAQSLGVPADRFYCNIQRFGNTSSASMPIAAAEYFENRPMTARPAVFAAFGAGFHWGAILVESCGGWT